LALPQAFVSQVETKRVEDDAFFVRHDAPTLRKFYGRIMTLNAMREYSPSFMEGWQYKAAFRYSLPAGKQRRVEATRGQG
jgi:hypothetical protein